MGPHHEDVTPAELSRLNALVGAGRYAELEQSSRLLLRQWPNSGTLFKALAISLWMQQKHADMLQALERATTLLPHDHEVHSDRGTALDALGKPEEATIWFQRAIEIKPDFKYAHFNLALALSRLGRVAEAIASHRRALAIDPNFFDALTNLGDALQQSGLHDNAIACYQRALRVKPNTPELHLGIGRASQSLGQGGVAEANYQRAIALNPLYVEAHCSFGRLLSAANRIAEALACVQRALAVRPDDTQIIVLHAELLSRQGDYHAAVAEFRRALEIDPTCEEAGVGAAVAEIAPIPMTVAEAAESCAAYSAALTGLEARLQLCSSKDPAKLVGTYRPFLLAYRKQDDCELMRTYGRICTTLMADWQRSTGMASTTRPNSSQGKLRVGFVSEYFRNHSVYNAITHGWLRGLDRKQFDVDVFCLDARADVRTNMARRIAGHFAQGDRTLREWTRAILERRPDILIYPEVGLSPTVVQLASMRLAKTQIVTWGHPTTSGLATLDYYLSAEAFESAGSEHHYTETLVKLPNLGVYYESPAQLSRAPGTLGTGGDVGPVMVCPGTPFKYSPEYDHVLTDIARRLGRCQFHFFNFEDGALTQRLLRRLHGAFAAAGLDASKFLVLRPWASTQQFHDILGSADLMLDTIGFSGFNTVMQALECGLPVVTVRGGSLRGRLGSGILERLSLNDLVAASPDSYVDIAVSLIENRLALAAARDRIRSCLPKAYKDQSAIDELQAFLLRVA